MSEPESKPPSQPLAERFKLFESINDVAISQTVEPDPLALKEGADLNKDYPESLSSVQQARDKAEIEQLSEGTRQTKLVNKARLIILASLFFIIALWIVSVVLLIIMVGFGIWGFTLSDKVIMTYVTTTTASVFGLFHIAARWLFSKD